MLGIITFFNILCIFYSKIELCKIFSIKYSGMLYKLSFIVLFIQSYQAEVTSQEKLGPLITLVFIGVWDIPDQPEFFVFSRNMARLASPHMNYRQEGLIGLHLREHCFL